MKTCLHDSSAIMKITVFENGYWFKVDWVDWSFVPRRVYDTYTGKKIKPRAWWYVHPCYLIRSIFRPKRLIRATLGTMVFRLLVRFLKLKKPKHHNENLTRGTEGEQEVIRILREKGYVIERRGPPYPDLLVNKKMYVEVKTSRLKYHKQKGKYYYSFGLTNDFRANSFWGNTVYVLRCLSTPPCHFVIPLSCEEGLPMFVHITSSNPLHYNGKWSNYLEAWEHIERGLQSYPLT